MHKTPIDYRDILDLETTDNNGLIDISFTLYGLDYQILDREWSESDLDQTGQDFTLEYYEDFIRDVLNDPSISLY